jgi:hypothetical protein
MDDAAIWGVVIMLAIAVAGVALLLRLSDKTDAGITFFDVLWIAAFVGLLVMNHFDLPPIPSGAAVVTVSLGVWMVRHAWRHRRVM